jgi:3-phosphoshikimate 1-carboxyvinyltransferase
MSSVVDREIRGPLRIRGTIRVPGDKSISHRAVMLGGVARGRSSVTNLSTAADVGTTIDAMRRVGVHIDVHGDSRLTLRGVGLEGFESLGKAASGIPLEIDCGNSGTTARLLLGLLGGASIAARLTGDASLESRPMSRVVLPLREAGVEFPEPCETLPCVVAGGKVGPCVHRLAVASAQVKSALILAALFACGETTLHEPLPTRDHTERLLAAMGGKIDIDETGEGRTIRVGGRPALSPLRLTVPGDISSAAFFIAASLLCPDSRLTVEDVLLNPTRAALLDVLRDMGGSIVVRRQGSDLPEPRGTVTSESSPLRGVTVEPEAVPLLIDEFPVIAVCGMFARGYTTVRGAAELRVKESDRIGAIVRLVRAFGGDIEEYDDGFRVTGRDAPPLHPGRVDSGGDHRIAMAASVAAAAIRGASVIGGADAVYVSFPEFYGIMRSCSV